MGSKVISLILLFLLMISLPFGCAQKVKTDEDYIKEWAQKTYGNQAIVTITAKLQSTIQGINLYRGVITVDGENMDGIFSIEIESKTVSFSQIQ